MTQQLGVRMLTLIAALWALYGTALPLLAQDDLRERYEWQAPVYVEADGLSRLELPLDVLERARVQDYDLRLLDALGAETPYLLESGRPERPERSVRTEFPLEIEEVDRSRVGRELAPEVLRETYVLRLPEGVPAGERFDLVVVPDNREFVRRIRIAAGADGARELVADASLFRLPVQSGGAAQVRERLRFPLPAFVDGRLRVEIEGESGGYLEPQFRLSTALVIPAYRQTRVPLTEIRREDDGRSTQIILERPRGLELSALEVRTATPGFSRSVEVFDDGQGGSGARVGAGEVFRVPAETTVEDLDIALAPVSGATLRVVIRNGDSPPLADLMLEAAAGRPSIVFTLPPGDSGEAAGTLLFGGGRLARPEYDLAGIRSRLQQPRFAERNGRIERIEELPAARLGEVSRNADFVDAPALSFAMRPGAEVDGRLYSHRRSLILQPSADGLSRLQLRLEDMAQAQPDGRDIRIVDEESRQWAYVLERETERIVQDLPFEGPRTEDGVSVYPIELPAAPATVESLEISFGNVFLDRELAVAAVRAGVESIVYSGRQSRGPQQAGTIRLPLDAWRVDSLELRVTDGDDAPLPLQSVEGRFPAPKLYVAAPAGEYALLLGNDEAEAPSYEMERVRADVLAAPSAEATAGPLEANPEFSSGAQLLSGGGPQELLLWGALLLAVGVLSYLTLRMVRREPDGD